MHHYELTRPAPRRHIHLASVDGDTWLRWGGYFRTHLNRTQAALILHRWRHVSRSDPENYHLVRRANKPPYKAAPEG